MDSLLGRILKLIFGSIVVGLFSGLIIPRVINAFSSDGSFELLELWLTFLIIIITTNILVFLVRFLTHHLSRIIAIKPHIDCNFTQFKFLSIPGVLTGIIPMGGGLFGGLGNEPIWEFVLLGIVGSLFWSIPLFLWLFKDDQIDPYVPPVATATESEQPTFLVGEAIRFGWNTMKSNLGFFIGILIVNVLIGVVPYVIERLVSSIPIRIVVGISFRVLNMGIWMGLIRIALKLYDNKGIGFTDLFFLLPSVFKLSVRVNSLRIDCLRGDDFTNYSGHYLGNEISVLFLFHC